MDILGFLKLRRIGTAAAAPRLVWEVNYVRPDGTIQTVASIGPTVAKCNLNFWCFVGISLYELPETRLAFPDGRLDYIVD